MVQFGESGVEGRMRRRRDEELMRTSAGFAVAATFKVFALNSEAARFIEWKYGRESSFRVQAGSKLIGTLSISRNLAERC
jgi:hypothetical protein